MCISNNATMRLVQSIVRPIAIGCLLTIAIASLQAAAATTDGRNSEMVGDSPEVRDAATQSERQAASARSVAITLLQALDISERQHAGSRAVDVSFVATSGERFYRILTLVGDQVLEHHIDADNGEAGAARIYSTIDSLDQTDRANVSDLMRTGLNLSDAVALAERETTGIVISAGLIRIGGKLNFAAVALCGDRLKEVVLEPPLQSKPRRRGDG
ncbi:PepSY domain-containing protein [Rhodopseudomonas sp.]|uniref:PepSY domain-containing protein n=1 Tax=Rhodopseudomonas sp. TaxID=1078 RepID=UPI002ED802E3